MKIVLDTCALLYWTLEPDRLTLKAATLLDRIGEDARGLISSATFWEIALKHRAGRLELGMTPAEYLGRVRRLPVEIDAVEPTLWLDSVALDWEHRDPVDRLVVALARREQTDVITSDREIREWYPRSVW